VLLQTFVVNARNNQAHLFSYFSMKRFPNQPNQPNQPNPNTHKGSPQAQLIGVGLDHTDGHKRITQSERFAILGGSEETHGRMTETVMKTFETLDRKGKTLAEVEKKELVEIIHKNTPN